MAKKRFNYWMGLTLIILAGTAGWAFYNLVNMGVEDLLANFGITNAYTQSGIVFGVILLAFILLGFGFKKSIDKILK